MRKRCDPWWFCGFNPTCASPYSYRRRRQNFKGSLLWRDAASALPVMGVVKRPVDGTPKGGALAWMTCEPPPLGRSIEIELPCSVFWRDAIRLPSPAIRVMGAAIWRQRCSTEPVKSHVVSAVCGRVNGIYKALPKGFLMRRICEAVSGSTGKWDVSRA